MSRGCLAAGRHPLPEQIKHEDFMEGINVVSAKKKGSLDYYA